MSEQGEAAQLEALSGGAVSRGQQIEPAILRGPFALRLFNDIPDLMFGTPWLGVMANDLYYYFPREGLGPMRHVAGAPGGAGLVWSEQQRGTFAAQGWGTFPIYRLPPGEEQRFTGLDLGPDGAPPVWRSGDDEEALAALESGWRQLDGAHSGYGHYSGIPKDLPAFFERTRAWVAQQMLRSQQWRASEEN